MFEALITLCLAADDTVCRETLLPGFEAAQLEDCEAALAAMPPDLTRFAPELTAAGAARCVPAEPALAFQQVAPGVFVHVGRIEEPDASNLGDVSNIGIVVGEEAVAVIDSGGARWIGEGVVRAVRELTDLPISHLVITHMHPDHAFGAPAIADAGATVVGHPDLDRALADRQSNYRESFAGLIGAAAFLGSAAEPTELRAGDKTRIDLGGRLLEVRSWPRAHTGTDLTVFDRATGVLFAGDLVFDRHTPALDGSLSGWQRVLGALAELPVEAVVPGHGGPLLEWPDGVRPMQRYLAVLEADVRAAIDDGQRIGEAAETAAQSEASRWQLFEVFNPRNAITAFTELEWE